MHTGSITQPPRFHLSAGAAVAYPLLLCLGGGRLLAALLPAVLAHELGHWAALRAGGVRILCVRWELPGLCMDTETIAEPGLEALCALAGPAAGLLWACVARFLLGSWADYSAALSLLLSAFNLLPALPLDGGRALLALTGRERALRVSGALCAAALLLGAIRIGVPSLALPALWLWLKSLRP